MNNKSKKLIKILLKKCRLLIGEKTASKALLELKNKKTVTIYGREIDFAEPKKITVGRMEIESWMSKK